MKKRTTKPKLLLLDANIIFRTHELGIWEDLLERVDVTVPSSVAYDEVLFTQQGDQIEDLSIPDLEGEGRLEIVEATAQDLVSTIFKFDRLFTEILDKGEREALALIDNGHAEGAHFCTTDGPAIIALAMLGYSEQGISLERVLKEFGLQQGRMMRHWTEQFFQEKVRKGQENLITGVGLRRE